jgi:hypothetical protein
LIWSYCSDTLEDIKLNLSQDNAFPVTDQNFVVVPSWEMEEK